MKQASKKSKICWLATIVLCWLLTLVAANQKSLAVPVHALDTKSRIDKLTIKHIHIQIVFYIVVEFLAEIHIKILKVTVTTILW